MEINPSSEKIRVDIASDQKHEKVVAEIYQGNKFVVLVSQDHATPLVEIPGHGFDESCISRVIPLKELQDALEIAVRRLNQ